ncbi:hypothetical protein BV22DRAFT_1118441 [Leucogyrophana mollusca]|uniref:Uncharacterized protein n=1 Tax=Leucogyrophana mollusca TaxID=85980 RepID=A0ACB8BNH3_9AGAM|nr:hypothetical protein BV22DRAFT_1118441 [Leucogyrophana mollusca]
MYPALQPDDSYRGAREIKPFSLRGWVFHSKSFCCCIPVRFGFVLLTLMSFLLGGALAALIWFELSHSWEITSKQHTALVITGIVESLLFILSIIGFIGVVASKQTFVVIYTYTIYIHFILNLIVGIYFLVEMRQSSRETVVDWCSESLAGTSKESACITLQNIPEYVFIVVTAVVLFLELFFSMFALKPVFLDGAVIASRYVHRLRTQKKANRERRIGYYHAVPAPSLPPKHSRTQSDASDIVELLPSRDSAYSNYSSYDDPYDTSDVLDIGPQPTTSYAALSTRDTDLTGHSRQESQQGTHNTDTASSRRFRALPPRPSTSTQSSIPSSSTPSSGRPSDGAQTTAPSSYQTRNHSPSSSDDDRRSLYSSEQVSTAAHSALMSHAFYVQPVVELPPPYHDGRQRPPQPRRQKP